MLIVAGALLQAAPVGAASTIPAYDKADAMAVQTDGKVVIAGEVFLGPYGDFVLHPAVGRVNSDGTLDTGFGDGGFKILTTANLVPSDVVIQPDGRIIVVGFNPLSGGNAFIARFTSAGQLDSSFSSDGVLMQNFGGTDRVRGVDLQSDGKIVVVGDTSASPPGALRVARYNPDGSLDTTFDPVGMDGIVSEADLSGDWTGFYAGVEVVVQDDDKIVVLGDTKLGRLNADGDGDTGFAGDGALPNVFNAAMALGGDLAIADGGPIDGKIVVVAQASPLQPPGDLHLARVNPGDGSLDAGFDGDGRMTITWGVPSGAPVGQGFNERVRLALEADGDAIVSRTIPTGSETDFGVARVTAAGILDTSYGGGVRHIDFRQNDSAAAGVAVDASSRAIVVGTAANDLYAPSADPSDYGLLRIGVSGDLDPSFDGDGKALITSSQTVDVIQGTPGNDTINGTAGNDVINAGKGNDTVNGGGGNDTIIGGPGNDTLNGDTVGGAAAAAAGPGAGAAAARAGRDKLIGGPGKDKLNGGRKADRLKGGGGKDRLRGGAGGDLLIGGPGLDVLIGGPGRDRQRQ